MNISEIKASKRKDRNTWEYTFHIDGKRYRRSGFKTKSEALRKAHEHVDEIVNGNTIDTEITFKDYYLKWLEVNDKKSLSKVHMHGMNVHYVILLKNLERINYLKISHVQNINCLSINTLKDTRMKP